MRLRVRRRELFSNAAETLDEKIELPAVKMPSNADFCAQCQILIQNLHRLFRGELATAPQHDRVNNKPHHFDPYSVGMLGAPVTTCPLCEVLGTVRELSTSPWSAAQTPNSHIDTLWAGLFLDWKAHFSIDHSGDERDPVEESDFFVLAVVSDFQTPDDCFSWMFQSKEQGRAVVVSESEPAQQLLYAPKVVSAQFDAELVRRWMRACETHHVISCQYEPSPGSDICLIDCRTWDVCRSVTTVPYVALSYVWGNVEQPSLVNGRVPRNASAVIRDAMKVTLLLGYRYLWVDQYCVDQNDAIAKERQISHMDKIYREAQLTIVAACGADANHGLPGVGKRKREPLSKALHLDNGHFSVVEVDYETADGIERSAWNQRGWTMQEAWLSRRLLCFTEAQCYWECYGAQCAECLEPCERLWRQTRRNKHFRPLSIGPRSKTTPAWQAAPRQILLSYMTDMTEMLGHFITRQLSFDKDALFAVTGVLTAGQTYYCGKEESESVFRPRAVSGLPIMLGASEHNTFRQMSLSTALSWYHAEEGRQNDGWCLDRTFPTRCHDFPSWTWAGWKGKIAFSKHWLDRSTESSSQYIIEDVYVSASEPSAPAITLQDIESSTNLFRLTFLAPEIPHEWLSFVNKTPTMSESNDVFQAFIRGCKAVFRPSERATPQQIVGDLGRGVCKLVLIAGDRDGRRALLWLLRKEGCTYIRSGVLEIDRQFSYMAMTVKRRENFIKRMRSLVERGPVRFWEVW